MLVTPTLRKAASRGIVISSTGVVRQNSNAPVTMSAGLMEPRALRGRFEFAFADAGTGASASPAWWYLIVNLRGGSLRTIPDRRQYALRYPPEPRPGRRKPGPGPEPESSEKRQAAEPARLPGQHEAPGRPAAARESGRPSLIPDGRGLGNRGRHPSPPGAEGRQRVHVAFPGRGALNGGQQPIPEVERGPIGNGVAEHRGGQARFPRRAGIG